MHNLTFDLNAQQRQQRLASAGAWIGIRPPSTISANLSPLSILLIDLMMASTRSRRSEPTPRDPTPSIANDLTLLSTFQTHIEDMRNLVQCKVCVKPLYEPYTLSCGHTYCYTCLANWFGGGNRKKKPKNCPDCRATVSTEPSPNYLLRDLVHMFISRVELLAEHETTKEHADAKREEARLIEVDKGPGGEGMFKGAFSRPARNGIGIIPPQGVGPIRDYEDGVDRCPQCAWELENGICFHCGFNDSEDDSDFSDDDTRSLPSVISIRSGSELDGELDPEDADFIVDDDDEIVHPGQRNALDDAPPPFHNPWASDEEPNNGFNHVEPGANRRRRAVIAASDYSGEDISSDDDDHTAIPDDRSQRGSLNTDDVSTSGPDSSSDGISSDDDESIRGPRRSRGLDVSNQPGYIQDAIRQSLAFHDEVVERANRAYLTGDHRRFQEEVERANLAHMNDDHRAFDNITHNLHNGFSPIRSRSTSNGAADVETITSNSDVSSDPDSDFPEQTRVSVVSRSNGPARTQQATVSRRPARRVVSDDESNGVSSSDEEESDSPSESEAATSITGESTPTPPQTAGDRRNRLTAQRARKGGGRGRGRGRPRGSGRGR